MDRVWLERFLAEQAGEAGASGDVDWLGSVERVERPIPNVGSWGEDRYRMEATHSPQGDVRSLLDVGVDAWRGVGDVIERGRSARPERPTLFEDERVLDLLGRLDSQEAQSWLEPFAGVSKAVGGVIRGENPLVAASRVGGPVMSDELVERGWPEWLARGLEVVVPDPTGASRVVDLWPVMSFVAPRLLSRFGLGRAADNAVASVRARGDSFGGSDAFERAVAEPSGLFKAEVEPVVDWLGVDPVEQVLPDGSRGTVIGLSRFDPTDTEMPNVELQNAVLRRVSKNTYNIGTLQNFGDPGDKGFLEAMDYIMRLADETGVTLTNQPGGFGRLSTDQLYRMYSKLGFETDPTDNAVMVRRPFDVNATEEERLADLAARQANEAQVKRPVQSDTNSLQSLNIEPSYTRHELYNFLEYNRVRAADTLGANYEDLGNEVATLTDWLDANAQNLITRANSGELNADDLFNLMQPVAPNLVITDIDPIYFLTNWAPPRR